MAEIPGSYATKNAPAVTSVTRRALGLRPCAYLGLTFSATF